MEVKGTEQNAFFTLFIILLLWVAFYFLALLFKLEKYGLKIHPIYALYKSTRMNAFLERTGRRNPQFWRVIGNIGIVASVGEIVFITYILFLNLYRFLYAPELAEQVAPLIPGITIRIDSLPWFLVAAGIVILTHEIAHGIQCAVEGVPIKSSALLLAVVTFGGAVEPDEEAMRAANMISKMRIFAAGSLINLTSGLLIIIIFILFGGLLPTAASFLLRWIHFLSINLALVNMLPIYPLDGGHMMITYVNSMIHGGRIIQQIAMYSFLALIMSNVVLSLVKFGLGPIPF